MFPADYIEFRLISLLTFMHSLLCLHAQVSRVCFKDISDFFTSYSERDVIIESNSLMDERLKNKQRKNVQVLSECRRC